MRRSISKKLMRILLVAGFLLTLAASFYGLGADELFGDDSVHIYYALLASKFYLDPKYLGALFVFYHEIMRELVAIPVLILFGVNEFFLRLLHALATFLTAIVIYKTAGLITKDKFIQILSLFLYAVNGVLFFFRLSAAIGMCALFVSLFVYYFIKFVKGKNDWRQFSVAIFFLYLAILSWSDPWFLMPAIIYILLKKNVLFNRKILGTLFLFILGITTYYFLWAGIPIVATRMGYIPDWTYNGFWAVFRRGAGDFTTDFTVPFKTLRFFNSLPYTSVFLIGIFFAIFNSKSNLLFKLAVIPSIFFTFVKNPGHHLYHFLPIYVILSSMGIKRIIAFIPRKSFVRLTVFILVIILSFNYINNFEDYFLVRNLKKKGRLILGYNRRIGYHALAYYFQNNSQICDLISTYNIDDFTFKIYAGRRTLPNRITKETKYIIVGGPAYISYYHSIDIEKISREQDYDKAIEIFADGKHFFTVYKKIESGSSNKNVQRIETDSFITEPDLGFSNLLPYLNYCSKIGMFL